MSESEVAVGSSTREAPCQPRALYANFSRRVNALCIDTLLLVALTLLVMSVAPALQQVKLSRVGLILAWWVVILLYEPVLVWRSGGTIGHHAMNLRVVDNRTLSNVSLPKALSRFIIKTILGILSFLTMQFSQRRQAVHDILTHSSVRIRAPKAARSHHYTVGPE